MNPQGPEAQTILVVDSAPVNVRLLGDILEREGYAALASETDPWQVVTRVVSEDPAVVLIDADLPGLDGFGVLQLLRKEAGLPEAIPVLLMSARVDNEVRERALAAGFFDTIGKPFDSAEVRTRLRNALDLGRLQRQIVMGRRSLEAKMRERNQELETAQVEIVDRLALAAEFRDDDTGDHTRRVGIMSGMLGRRLGLAESVTDIVQRAAPLHDIGKIGIPDAILLKPGPLEADEMELMKTHTTIGHRILTGQHPLLWMAALIALNHHERWDGSGYPAGLLTDDIPLPGRIVAVADVFDTLISRRAYREPWPRHRAIAEVAGLSGKHFDPRVVEAFLNVVHDPA